MNKIKTIFDRDWEGNRKVINKLIVDFDFATATATEKLDGTNVRATIRNGTCVRLEKRRNPDKKQKAMGIEEPWYVDADPYDSGDKYLFEALENSPLQELPDGEWSAEAIGPKIQGNPLGMTEHMLVFFSLGQAPVLENVPTDYEGLKAWLPKQMSAVGSCPIEGVVWHGKNGDMVKIKAKDF